MRILTGDVRTSLLKLPGNHAHCVVTSPPYWSLRSYLPASHELKPNELGSERTPEEYIENMVAVFREVRRVLRTDGLCFINIGDAYAASGRGGHPAELDYRKQTTNRGSLIKGHKAPPGLKPGDLCLIPARLALALQADSWYLRQIIVWAKPSPMPESVQGTRWERCRVKLASGKGAGAGHPSNHPAGLDRTVSPGGTGNAYRELVAVWSECPGCPKCSPHGGHVLRRGSWRCTTAHEYILMLAKSGTYFADQDGAREPFADNREDGGRNPRSVWTIGPEPLSEPHYAAFPSALPEKCINVATSAKGCCPHCGAQWARIVESAALTRERPNDLTKRTGEEGTGNHCPNRVAGVESKTLGWKPTCDCPDHEPIPARVLDPFLGSGTTAIQAVRMGRDAIGCELNPDYIEMTRRRLNDAVGFLADVTEE